MLFEINLLGADEVLANMEALAIELGGFEPELQFVGNYMRKFFENDVFESEGAVYGSPWAPLAESTVRIKAKKYPGRGILEASGRLRHSFELMTTNEYAMVYNDTPYGKYLEYGTRNMPARMFVKLDEERAAIILEKFEVHLMGRLMMI